MPLVHDLCKKTPYHVQVLSFHLELDNSTISQGLEFMFSCPHYIVLISHGHINLVPPVLEMCIFKYHLPFTFPLSPTHRKRGFKLHLIAHKANTITYM